MIFLLVNELNHVLKQHLLLYFSSASVIPYFRQKCNTSSSRAADKPSEKPYMQLGHT